MSEQTKGERLREMAECLNNDHLILAAIENINTIAAEVYQATDALVESGEMTLERHDHHGCRAGGAMSEAIEMLLEMRRGNNHTADDLRKFAVEHLALESEATQ